MKLEFMYTHVCYKLRNSLGGYGGIRVIGVSDNLGGSSSHGRGGVVATSAVVHSRWCVKNLSDEFLWPWRVLPFIHWKVSLPPLKIFPA